MPRVIIVSALLLSLTLVSPKDATAKDYLSGSELAAVGLGTAGISFLGTTFKKTAAGKRPVIRGHFPLEQSFQRWLGGKYSLREKGNFLDTELGAFATPFASGLALTVVNLSYPRASASRDAAEDLFLFISGAIATKGITDLTKGFFARERPYLHQDGDKAATNAMYSQAYSQGSFFSGHTSSAFFSASFLNLRVRETMRQRMTNSQYHSWRWASSGLLYSWASVVGLSRIHAYKHHPSDVLIGALAGVLVSELFFNLTKNTNKNQGAGLNGAQNIDSPIRFRIRVPF